MTENKGDRIMPITIARATEIHTMQHDALENLVHVVEKVLTIANSDRHYDDTENEVFNELRVICGQAKDILKIKK